VHLTKPVPNMTYNVLGVTLNLTQRYLTFYNLCLYCESVALNEFSRHVD